MLSPQIRCTARYDFTDRSINLVGQQPVRATRGYVCSGRSMCACHRARISGGTVSGQLLGSYLLFVVIIVCRMRRWATNSLGIILSPKYV